MDVYQKCSIPENKGIPSLIYQNLMSNGSFEELSQIKKRVTVLLVSR